MLQINDQFCLNDNLSENERKPLWAKTRIIGGYEPYIDKYGITRLGETLFDEENMVTIGGVQYAMEKIFDTVGPASVSNAIGYLNNDGIGSQTYVNSSNIYPNGHCVCLWGLGLGGAAENTSTVLDVKYRETNISEMIPFRFTNETFEAEQGDQYFGKRTEVVNGEERTAYYLKAFENKPKIYHRWDSGEIGVDGPELTGEALVTDTSNKIETYTEITLRVNPLELKEWFDLRYNIEEVRFNSLALYTGVYDSASGDYAMIRMFSKLNIPTERLSLLKDLVILYRVYGA